MVENEYIEKLINETFDEILLLRRDIHRYPELSNNEKETSKKIIKILFLVLDYEFPYYIPCFIPFISCANLLFLICFPLSITLHNIL